MKLAKGRIKLLYLITRLTVGGAQKIVLESIDAIDRNQFDVMLAFGPETSPEGSLQDYARQLKVPISIVPSLVREVRPWRDARALIELRNLLKQEKVDVVHTHSSKAGILGRAAAYLAKVPVIIHTVHGWGFHVDSKWHSRFAFALAERLVARFTDRLIMVSNTDLDRGMRFRIGRREQYHVWGGAINVKKFQSVDMNPTELKNSLKIPAHAKIVGSVMRLSPQKDPLTFIQCASQVAAELPGVHFVVAGDGPLRGEAEKKIQNLNLQSRFSVLGLRDDVPSILRLFDVFLLTSRWEGQPLVVLEAMAAGCPVVATGIDGTKEIIQNGWDGYLFPPGDSDSAARAVIHLLNHPGESDNFRDRARVKVDAHDIHRLAQFQMDLYRSLLQGKAS